MQNLSSSQISALARLFSSGVMQELSKRGKSPTFARLAKEILGNSLPDAKSFVSNFFDMAFDELKKVECRHEYIYKAALTQRVLLGTHSLQTASMLTEFRIGDCKADLAILNGTSTVYEIKSERDSLTRLERQIEMYKKFFASVYVIAGDNHLENIRSIVSDDIGILKLSKRYQISTLREARETPDRTCPLVIYDSIRIEEAKRILTLMDIPIPDVPNTEMHSAMRERFSKLPATNVHDGMIRILKTTRNLQPLSELVKNLPVCLRSAVLSIPLRRADHDRLLSAVHTPLQKALMWG